MALKGNALTGHIVEVVEQRDHCKAGVDKYSTVAIVRMKFNANSLISELKPGMNLIIEIPKGK